MKVKSCNARSAVGALVKSVLHGRQAAFTLIELLVVIAIISILAALLLPALGGAKDRGKRALCMSNVNQVDLALQLYAQSYNEKFPQVASGRWAWDLPVTVAETMVQNASWKVFYCPCCGLTEQENLYLWNFSTNNSNPKYRYRVVGYAMTFPGTSTVVFSNQNPSLLPQSMTDTNTGITYSAPFDFGACPRGGCGHFAAARCGRDQSPVKHLRPHQGRRQPHHLAADQSH